MLKVRIFWPNGDITITTFADCLPIAYLASILELFGCQSEILSYDPTLKEPRAL